MKNFVEPHCHIQSLDSASTPDRFAQREVELGTGYITTTDHGTLEVTRSLYDMCAPGGKYHGKLKPILGIEGYFRDPNCEVLTKNGYDLSASEYKSKFKYCHITLHAADEKAYFKLVKKISDADLVAEQHGSERKPLFNWRDLEEIGAENVTGTSGCLIGMCGRHLMANNDPKSAVGYYEKLRSLFRPGQFYVELFPHSTTKYFQSAVIFDFEDGSNLSLGSKRKVKTESGEHYAEDVAASFKRNPAEARIKHSSVLDVMENRKWTGKAFSKLRDVRLNEGFIENECKPWCAHSDYQLEVNRFLYSLATKYKDPVLVSGDSHFAYPDEYEVQNIRLGNWRFGESHHRMSSQEAFTHFQRTLGVPQALYEQWVENSYEWASRFDNFTFSKRQTLPTSFYPTDTLRHAKTLIDQHGRMNWSDLVMVERLKKEITLLHKNGTIDLLPYFFLCEELTNLYTKHGQILGSGRGSAGGVLLAYLLGITSINPISHGLSLERFLTLDRIASGKLPDIDMDFPHRDLLINANGGGYLKERFGSHVAQMSTDITLKLKSAIKDVHRFTAGRVSPEIDKICEALPDAPQGIATKDFVFGYEVDGEWFDGVVETSPVLQSYIATYPKEWASVQSLLGHRKTVGKHACGFVVANTPVDEFIPMGTVSGTRVTAFTAPSVEAAGGLKVDLLVVNAVRDIGRCIDLIQKRHGGADWATMRSITDRVQLVETDTGPTPYGQAIPFKGGLVDVWNLPTDIEVYKDICQGKVETVFQLDAAAARQGLANFPVVNGQPTLKSIGDLAVFTALDRPGPLDAYVTDEKGNKHNMLVEFARRARGEIPSGEFKILTERLPETYGVLVFQEDLQRIFQEIGGTTGIQANDFRQRIGKKKITDVRKKDEPLFMAGAVPKLGKEMAEELWGSVITFGKYGFCVGGDQEIVTNKGHVSMKTIVESPDATLKVASYNVKTHGVEFITPSVLMHQGIKEVFEVELEDGTTIKATGDHKFMYDGEWISLNEVILGKDMEVLTWEKDRPLPVDAGKI